MTVIGFDRITPDVGPSFPDFLPYTSGEQTTVIQPDMDVADDPAQHAHELGNETSGAVIVQSPESESIKNSNLNESALEKEGAMDENEEEEILPPPSLLPVDEPPQDVEGEDIVRPPLPPL
jgi:hypothetical protein